MKEYYFYKYVSVNSYRCVLSTRHASSVRAARSKVALAAGNKSEELMDPLDSLPPPPARATLGSSGRMRSKNHHRIKKSYSETGNNFIHWKK